MEEGDGRFLATAKFDEESGDEGDQNDSPNGVVDQAEEERLGVIAKYDRGRDEGAQIDDWEDPAFPLHHTTDRYGFIHDTELPKTKAEHNKRIQIESERSHKWLKMRNKWEKFRGSEKLKQRTYKGIPDNVRGLFWGLLLDLQTIKSTQRGKYDEMLQLARKYSPDVRQIDLDVNRTYRDTQMFRERFGTCQKSLFNILCAYSVYNSEVGYCQGMSQIAALLLMYLPEEDAFWALAQLMTHHKYGMHGFFIAGFPKLLRFQAHHDRVLQKMLPRLKRHFDKHGVDTGLYTLKWFFQCFLDRVPFELSLRLWDIFLLEGDKVLICGAYTILKAHSKQLLARKNMDDILHYLQARIPSNFGMDSDKAIEQYQQCSEDLAGKKLDTAGEPRDEEFPKKPFGVIEPPAPAPPKPKPARAVNRIKTPEPKNNNSQYSGSEASHIQSNTDDEVPLDKLSLVDPATLSVSSRSSGGTSRKLSPSPPPPPPRSPFPQQSESERWTPSPEHNMPSMRPSASLVGHHLMDSRLGSQKKRVPPPVSPRKAFQNATTISSMADGDIPGGDTVKIHVPYKSSTSILSQPKQSSSSNQHHHTTGVPHHGPSSLSGRNGFDVSKSDPNRIKIDVSSSQSTLIN